MLLDLNHLNLTPKSNHPKLNTQFQTLIQQHLMGININPLLQTNPSLRKLTNDLKTCLPAIFNQSRKLIYPNQPIPAQIKLKQTFTLQPSINFGFHRGYPRAFVWSLRPHANPTQCDHLILWAIAQHACTSFIQPEHISLVIIALSLRDAPKTNLIYWSFKKHLKFQKKLAHLIQSHLESTNPNKNKSPHPTLPNIDYNAIPEIPI